MLGTRRFFVFGVVFSLVAGLVWGLPPVAVAAVEPDSLEQPVPAVPVVSKPAPVQPSWTPWSPPAPVWPWAGEATVQVAASGSASGSVAAFGDGRVGVESSVSPGGLPVTVTVPEPVSGSLSGSLSGPVDSFEVEQRLLRGLPAGVGTAGVPSVRVSVFDQAVASALGVRGVVLSVANAGAVVAGAAPVKVSVGYGGFRYAFGGNYGDRLRLVGLPGCAVSTPELVGCRAPVAVAEVVNDRVSVTVSGVVDLGTSGGAASESGVAGGSGSQVLAVVAGSSSETGDWAATPLSQTSSWQAGGSSGDFSYSVPIEVPPAPGGLVPQIAMSYSSGGIDGLTRSKNSQASWVGEGWDYHPGYVERQYRPCAADGSGVLAGNLCWAETSPVSLVLNGKSTRLIDLGVAGWKAEDDSDGWKVERLTGALVDNGAGEAFKVTTRDGTQYLFGSKRPGGPGEDDNPAGQYGGVLKVEVYGNNAGDPCYHTGGLAASHCSMPYRWNLDRVVDVHGNVIDLQWWRHRGNYGGYGDHVFPYDISGRLTDIYYGANQVTGTGHTGRVQFFGQFRCFDTDTVCSNNLSLWRDVPWDQFCPLGATSCIQKSPTFYNIYRLYLITTFVKDGAGWSQVGQWQNGQGYPTNSDGTSPSLWLNDIWRPGYTNSIRMSGQEMNNRVDTGPGRPATVHRRVTQINNGVGGTVNVLYSGHDCTAGSLPAQVDYNPRRCFPQNSDGVISWWHKYVATDVYLGDHVGGGEFQRWHYDYNTYGSSTDVLWKHDLDWHSGPALRTWSRWAGYPTVVTTYSQYDGAGPKQVTETLYFRGLNLDWTLAGGPNTKQVTLNDNWVSGRTDDQALAGRPARTLTWDGPVNAGRTNWTAATRHYYTVTTTGTLVIVPPPNIVATRVRENDTFHQTWPTFRETRTTTEYEATYGLPVKVTDYGDTAVGADDRCVLTEYTAANTATWLIGLARQSMTTTCAAGPAPGDVLAVSRSTYDNLPYGAAPVRGLATRSEVADAVTAYPLVWSDFHVAARSSYDAHGRVSDSFDALERQSTTVYSPAAGGPVTQVTVRGPAIGGQRWDTVTTLEPKFGVPTKVVDVNGLQTNAEYDSNGRLVKVWKDNRATTGTPDVQYTYHTEAPTAVSTRTLGPDGQQIEAWQIFDGLQRPRQTQTVSATDTGGRVIADTHYNGIGQVAKTSTYFQTGAPTAALTGADDKDIRVQQRVVYDNHGRITHTQQWAGDGTTSAMLWQTVTGYDADITVTVTPPAGGTATTTIHNARGKTVELRQHSGATPASGVYATTTYAYDRLDQLTAVTDTAANTWSYSYDLLGRQTQTIDPDAGTSLTVYDNAGQVTATRDGRSQWLHYTYDNLGRKTHLRQDTAGTGTLRASWTYDTAVFGNTTTTVKGRLASATRHQSGTGGQDYVQAVGSYDYGYRPLTATTTAPGFGTAGTTLAYTITNTYRANGAAATTTLPAIGGLPGGTDGETLQHDYHPATGLPRSMTNTENPQTIYINYTAYHYDGLVYRQTRGPAGKRIRTETSYGNPGRRLSAMHLHTENPSVPGDYGTAKFANDLYTYDPAGNITAIGSTHDGTADQQECFRYDPMRRLTEAWTQTTGACTTPQRTGADAYWRQWTFDTLGNRLTQTYKNPTTGDTTLTHTNGTAGGVTPHQVKTITATGPIPSPTRTFTYDPAGNTTTRTDAEGGTQNLTWDPEGHLATTTEAGQTTTYTYDTEGRRLATTEPGKKTLYLPDGTELDIPTTGPTLATRHYNGIAVRDPAGLRWTVTDHHGTPTAQIDATNPTATDAIKRQRTMPYGEPRGPQAADWKGTKGYLNATKDPSGLVHLNAREYDPSLGRFISVDPIMDLTDPQQWNAYSYSNANPVTNSDPSGLKPVSDNLADQRQWQKTQTDTYRQIVKCNKKCTPTDMLRHIAGLKELRFAELAVKWGNELQLDPRMLLAVILRESSDRGSAEFVQRWQIQGYIPIPTLIGEKKIPISDPDGPSVGITNVKADLIQLLSAAVSSPDSEYHKYNDLVTSATLSKVVEDENLSVALTAIAMRIQYDKIRRGQNSIAENDIGVTSIEAASAIHQVKNGHLIVGEGDSPELANVITHIRKQRFLYYEANNIICNTGTWWC